MKTEFDKEIHKAEEIKQLMAREAEIAATPQHTDPRRFPASATPLPVQPVAEVNEASPPAAAPAVTSDDKPGHGTPQT